MYITAHQPYYYELAGMILHIHCRMDTINITHILLSDNPAHHIAYHYDTCLTQFRRLTIKVYRTIVTNT